MLSRIYKWPLIFAIILHLSLFTFLFIKFAHHASYSVPSSSVKVIQAVVVNQSQVNKQLHAIEAKKHAAEQAKKAAEMRKIEAEQKHIATEKRLKAEKLAKQKAIAAKKQREVELKKRKELAQKRKQEVKKQKQLAAEKTKKAAEEKQIDAKKAKKLAVARQATIKQNMTQQLAAEQKQMAAAQKMQGEVNKYKALILQAISSYLILPPNLPKGISCKLLVSVAPGGEVLSVEMIQSSGNAALDRSAKTAVLKASPLPVPKDTDLFDNFRTIRLTVRPEGVF